MRKSKKDSFWISYADLMTSLFFVMLVLFILNQVRMSVSLRELTQIKEMRIALSSLNKEYFNYDSENKRYKLNIDSNFLPNSSEMTDIHIDTRKEILNAGKNIYSLMLQLEKEYPNVSYLLVIEGHSQRRFDNYINYPNEGYRLSYNRALSLVNYWKANGLKFSDLKNCEILIAGSGYFGKSREVIEFENRKFTIQITPKLSE